MLKLHVSTTAVGGKKAHTAEYQLDAVKNYDIRGSGGERSRDDFNKTDYQRITWRAAKHDVLGFKR